jgi:hypothetical protein
MPEKAPRLLNSPLSNVFLKWMGRVNTFFYRRNGGEGLGGTFQKIPVALLTTSAARAANPGSARCTSCVTATG